MGKYDFDRYDPPGGYSLDDILEEVRQMRKGKSQAAPARPAPKPAAAEPERKEPLRPEAGAPVQRPPSRPAVREEAKEAAPAPAAPVQKPVPPKAAKPAMEEFKSEFRPKHVNKQEKKPPVTYTRAGSYYNPITPEEIMKIKIDRPAPKEPPKEQEEAPAPKKFTVHIPEEELAPKAKEKVGDDGERKPSRKPLLHHEVVVGRGRIVDTDDNTEQTREIDGKPQQEQEAAPARKAAELRSPLLKEMLLEDEEPEQEEAPAARPRMRFSGREPQNEPGETAKPAFEGEEEEYELSVREDEFTDPSQAEEIQEELSGSVRSARWKTVFAGILAFLLGLLQFLPSLKFELPEFIHPAANPRTYLLVCTVLMVLAFALCFQTVIKGLVSLFRGGAPLDSALSAAFLAAAVQQGLLIAFPNRFAGAGGGLPVYAAVLVLLLFLNQLGKWLQASRVERNFAYLTSEEPKKAVLPVEDQMLADALAKPMDIPDALVLSGRGAGFFERFLTFSFAEDSVQRNASVLAPVGIIGSIAVGFGTMLTGRTFFEALTVAVTLLCICVPSASMLASGLMNRRAATKSLEDGAMLSGGEAAEEASSADAVLVDAADLFSKDAVLLQGIKLLGDEPIDKIILYAAAVTVEAKSPLAEMFMKVLQDKTEYLPKVEYTAYSDRMGLIGKIEGRTILIGNRELVSAHGIVPPAAELEEKIRRSGRNITYVAIDQKLAALFAMTYSFDDGLADALETLENHGIGMIVSTTDANITPALLENGFGLSEGTAAVAENVTVKQYGESIRSDSPAPAGVLYSGETGVFLRLLGRCTRLCGALRYVSVVQTAAMVLGYGLTVFLALYPGTALLSAAKVLAVQAVTLMVGGILPSLRRF